MIRTLPPVAAALILGISVNPAAVMAQQPIESAGLTIATTPAIVSDYSFRGISQTRNRPAAQVTLDVEHSSGVYVGAFLSNVAFAGTNARQELDLLAGYRMEVAGVKLDAGVVYYTYPGYETDTSRGFYEANFLEAAMRASYEIAPVKFVGQLAYSPNFFNESGSAIYVEGGFDIALDFGFTIGARAGYQWIDRNFSANRGAYGADDYANFSLMASREIVAGFVGTVSAVFTSFGDRSECFGGTKLCDDRVIVGISRPF